MYTFQYTHCLYFCFVDLPAESIADSKLAVCMDTVYNLSSGKRITERMLNEIVQLPDNSGCGHFYTVLNQSLRELKGDPIFSMLSVELYDGESLDDAFCAIEDSAEVYEQALYKHLYVTSCSFSL